VSLPAPRPGLVIRYSYLWHREYLQGIEEGRKDRPCSIVAAIRREQTGETRVLVLPITHGKPDSETVSIEIPAAVKKQLDLDEDRSWIVLTEWNEFTWPGPDLRRMGEGDDASVAYSILPPQLFEKVRKGVLALVKGKNVKAVGRVE
jgi:hypothetical protein